MKRDSFELCRKPEAYIRPPFKCLKCKNMTNIRYAEYYRDECFNEKIRAYVQCPKCGNVIDVWGDSISITNLLEDALKEGEKYGI